MSATETEKRGGVGGMGSVAVPGAIVATGGEAEARGFVEAVLPEAPVYPTMEMERVQVLDPRHSPTLPGIDRRKLSGPRVGAEERAAVEESAAAAASGLEGLERPATKMQAIQLDPAMLAELAQQAAEKAARPSAPSAPSAPGVPEERGRLPLPGLTLPGLPRRGRGVAVTILDLPPAPTAAETAKGRRVLALRIGVPLAVAALLGVTVVQMMPKVREGAGSAASAGASPSAGSMSPSAAREPGVMMAATTVQSASLVGVEALDAGGVVPGVAAAAAGAAAAATPTVGVGVKRNGGGETKKEDPYDAARPVGVKTAEEAVVPVAPMPPTTVISAMPVAPVSAIPVAPLSPPTSTVRKSNPVEDKSVF